MASLSSANETSSAAPQHAADVPSASEPAADVLMEPQASGENYSAAPTHPPERVDAEPASEVLGPPEAPEIIFAAPPTQPPERVDAKLWSGASAAGWRLSCGTGGSGDKFRSPSGISIDSRERALEAAAFEDAPAVSLLRDGRGGRARARAPRAAFAGFEVVDGFAGARSPSAACGRGGAAAAVRGGALAAPTTALGALWVTKKQLLGESAIVRDLPCELVDPRTRAAR